jgi:Protein of unknown function (DUF1579)
MKTRLLWVLAAAVMLVLVARHTPAGDDKIPIPKPGPEHKLLAKLEGTWDCKAKFWMGPGEPKESTGAMKRTMIMGGLYLQEKFAGDFLGTKFQGFGVIGYDTNKKKFVSAWIDNFGTGIMVSEGTYDPDAKTLTYTSEEFSPAYGGKVKTRDVLKLISDDRQVFEMFRTPMGGKEMKAMEITYTRAQQQK